MGFLSYNLNFYRNELQKLESAPAAQDSLYHARQLLRMLDDLTGEGYTGLNEQLENAFSGVSRLQKYLEGFHAAPFPPPEKPVRSSALLYTEQDTELRTAILQAMQTAAALPAAPSPFSDRLREFCRWIGYDRRTAYIFLLRDTLLPFVCYCAHGRKRIYPWLLSRSSFAALTGRQNADDEIRASVYRALEAGCSELQSFRRFVIPDIRQTMQRYPQAKNALCAMLAAIRAERILVVESGCAGTFPLLLMSLDSRVDLRMYTTYPYLAGIYKTRIFTPRYEENRMFETMVAQELYFRFSALRDGRFYVRKCTDADVGRRSLQEIRNMMK